MKKLLFTVILIIVLLTGCTSTPVPPSSHLDFSDVIGKEWKLIEVRVNSRNIGFSRNSLARDGFGDVFTLRFDSETISGTGAPNRYSAPYTLSSNQAIGIMQIRSTLMASIREPENLREHDFFVYLQNSYEWKLVNNNLELYSRLEDGRRIILIFS